MCIVNEYSDYSINEHLSEMYNEMCGHYLQIKWHKVIKKNVNKVNCYGGPLETHVHTHTQTRGTSYIDFFKDLKKKSNFNNVNWYIRENPK